MAVKCKRVAKVKPVVKFVTKPVEAERQNVEVLSPLPPMSIEVRRGNVLLAVVAVSGVHITSEFLKNKSANRGAVLSLAQNVMDVLA